MTTPPKSKPAEPEIILPLIARIISRGDGTFILKPTLPDSTTETWLTVKEAAAVLGRSVARSQVYQFVGVYLIYRKPTPGKIEVALSSALALRKATHDPEFWSSRERKQAIQKAVEQGMSKLTASSLQ